MFKLNGGTLGVSSEVVFFTIKPKVDVSELALITKKIRKSWAKMGL
ncbi:hypothetical protein [Gynuella sp.]